MMEPDPFAELIRLSFHRVVLVVLPVTRELSVAARIVTHTFAEAWAHRDTVADDPLRETWLIRSALIGSAAGSREGSREGTGDSVDQRLDRPDRSWPNPDDEPAQKLLDALTWPPARTVQAVVLHDVLGLSIDKVAKLTAVTVDEARSRLRHGWIQLAMDLCGDVRVERGIAGLKDLLGQRLPLPTIDQLRRFDAVDSTQLGVA
jgi:DNA-directed RNA polymerase specialized sigma24 family protein